MTTLARAIYNIEAAKTGGRELDADIHEALGYEVIRERQTPKGVAWRKRGYGILPYVCGSSWSAMSCFSSDVQAAYALMARYLADGRQIAMSLASNQPSRASMREPNGLGYLLGHGQTPALALCGLMLRLTQYRNQSPLSPQEFDLARSALGLGKTPGIVISYRNRFVTIPGGKDGQVWADMVTSGFAEASKPNMAGHVTYSLTFEGALRALKRGEALSHEDFPWEGPR